MTSDQAPSRTSRRILGLALLATLALVVSACSVTSLEERRAALEADETTMGPSVTESRDDSDNSDESDELARGPVLIDEPPDGGTAEAAWGDLSLEAVVIAQYESPISLKSRSGSDDLWVAQRNGIIRRIQRTFNDDGVERIAAETRAVLDLSDQVSLGGERGLLDIEFSLDGRLLYVSYTDLDGASVVAEYDIARSNRANPASARELIRIPQPASNHNGGSLAMGADGFLYIGLGDGGGSGDPEENGQDTSTLLGSVLRIDPVASDNAPYLIPDGNPFAFNDGGAAEIFLWGVRNPWRFSFDQATGDMWLADVGQNSFEEINHLTAAEGFGNGANLGWNEMEAFEPFDGGSPPPNSTAPAFAYAHEDGRCSVTGGHVYRGDIILPLQGVYLFGDYCTGEVFGLTTGADTVVRPLSIQVPPAELVSIGEGPDGELYLVLSEGEIRRIQLAIPDAG